MKQNKYNTVNFGLIYQFASNRTCLEIFIYHLSSRARHMHYMRRKQDLKQSNHCWGHCYHFASC